MVIDMRIEEGAVVLRPRAERLDDSLVGELRRGLEAPVPGDAKIVVNLRDVEFMDSSALGALISALRGRQGRGEVVLCEVRDPVMGLLRLTGLIRIFPCFDTEEDALASRPGRVV